MLGLSYSVADELLPDVMLTDEIPPDAQLLCASAHQAAVYFYRNDHFIVQAENGWPFPRTGEWPMLLRLGVMRRILYKHPVYLLHCSLLETHPGRGVVIFGRGGIGKTTTMARFRAAGGVCHADDIVLLCMDESGEWYAHPLPTCSYYAEHWSPEFRCPFHSRVKVDAIYMLRRGVEREEIYIAPIETCAKLRECQKGVTDER